jgi:geranyl-CoA carboxylase alpha subunit
MNTRLQVEHPVTECITGLDLVEWQLRVAAGEPLPLKQEEIRFAGHAIEARLYAEDPYDGWRPQTGRVVHWQPQRAAIRIDHGIAPGDEVTPYYDAMVAKFIAHGRDRAEAARRLTRALEEVPLLGLRTNGRFLRDLVDHPQFVAAQMTTARIDEWAEAGAPILRRPAPPEAAWRIAAAVRAGASSARPASVVGFDLELVCGGERRRLRAPVDGVVVRAFDGAELRVDVDGVSRRLHAHDDGRTLHLVLDGAVFEFDEASAWPAREAGADPARLRAPVAGVVAHLAVAVGDTVEPGQPIASVEAMKMEMWLHAAAAGTVCAVHVAPKDPVAAGALLVELEIAP